VQVFLVCNKNVALKLQLMYVVFIHVTE